MSGLVGENTESTDRFACRRQVIREYEDRNERGLFHLYLNQSFFGGVRGWTNTELLAKGKSKVSKNEFSSYYSIHFTRIFIGSLVSQIYLGYENSVVKGLIYLTFVLVTTHPKTYLEVRYIRV